MGRKSFGSIRRLPSGNYQARYQGPNLATYNGPHTFITKTDADAWLSREHALISAGAWTPPPSRNLREGANRITVAQWLERCLVDRRTRTRKPIQPTTADNYRKLLDVIIPDLGDVPIDRLTRAQVTTWYTGLDPEHRTRNGEAYDLFRSMMHDAVEDGLIDENPVRIRGLTNLLPAGLGRLVLPTSFSST